MSEPRPVDDQMEILQSGHDPSRFGEGVRRIAGRLLIPLVLAVVIAVAWFEVRDAQRDRAAARVDDLTAAAVEALETDTELARLLALAAADASVSSPPSSSTMAALRRTLSTNLLTTYTPSGGRGDGGLWTELSPDGTLLVATGMYPAGTYLEVWDIAARAVMWSTDLAEIGFGSTGIEFPLITPGGDKIIAGLTAEPVPAAEPLGVAIWDAETGELIRHIGIGRCGAIADAVSDTHLLVTSPRDISGTCWLEGHMRLDLIELETGHRQLITSQATWFQPRTMSADGRVATFTAIAADGAYHVVVVDTTTGAEILSITEATYAHGLGHPRLLNDDGSLLLTGHGPVAVWDVASGTRVATIDVRPASVFYAGFGPDGVSVFTSGTDGFHWWNALDGAHISTMPLPWLAEPAMFSLAGDLALVSRESPTAGALLLSTEPRRDVSVIDTCYGFAGTLSTAGGNTALGHACGADDLVTFLAEPSTGVVREVPGQLGPGLALSPDGSQFVRQDAPAVATGGLPDPLAGPVRIRDFATGDPVVELAAPEPPFLVSSVRWSPDSRLIAAIDSEQEVAVVWDTSSGRMVERHDGCWFGVADVAFTPDGNELVVSCRGRRLASLSTDGWAEVRTADLEPGSTPLMVVGFSADGSTLLALDHDGGGSLYWIDTETFDTVASAQWSFADTPTSWTVDPSEGLVAVGMADGRVEVWDVEGRAKVDEIGPETSPIAGVAFIDDHRLAVAPRDGGVLLYPLDPADVVAAVRSSVTRNLTPAECANYGFGDSCPAALDDPVSAVRGAQIITGLPSGSAM
jgi:WD40 repeat protein